jgi:hypothetical protein
MPRNTSSQAEKLRHFQVLARVSNVINSSLEPKKVLELVLSEAVRVMQATSGSSDGRVAASAFAFARRSLSSWCSFYR